MTNFEKIKAMSQQELAEFLCGLFEDECTEDCPGFNFCLRSIGRLGTSEYLQQEAEVE